MAAVPVDADVAVHGAVSGTDQVPGYEEEAPNVIKCSILRGRGLRARDKNVLGKDTSDPLVKIIFGGVEKRTKVKKKTLEPVWNETFDIFAVDSSSCLTLLIEDDDIGKNDFLGLVQIPLDDLKHQTRIRRWFKLMTKDGLPPTNSLGEVEVQLQWYHDPQAAGKTAPKKKDLLDKLKSKAGIAEESSDTDEGHEEEEEGMDKAERAAAEEARIAAEEEEARRKEELHDELLDMSVTTGDYMIYVHIIEVRDLRGEDPSGTSDPVVYIEAFDQKFATEVKDSCLNAVYDEQFAISCRNLDKEVFQEGVIRISVMDADMKLIPGLPAAKNDLIGAFNFDATYVYFQKDHEMHRQWVALINDEDPEESGTQGYIKLSIQVVGPGDKIKLHDENEDRRAEQAAEASGVSMDSMVIMPKTIPVERFWLVTTVWKAEYLPVMDPTLVGKGGGDYYFSSEVAGGKALKSKKKTLRGSRGHLNPYWRTELWQPINMPCMSGNIRYSVWDHDTLGDNELVAMFSDKVKHISRSHDSRVGPHWRSLYGPPLYVPSVKAAKLSNWRKSVDWKKKYQEVPSMASTYRGRVLLSQQLVKNLPVGHDEMGHWKRKVPALSFDHEPETRQYGLRAFVASGTEIPRFTSVANLGAHKMSIRISVGKYEVRTSLVGIDDGVCEWFDLVESHEPLTLPKDVEQLPDILIHLVKGKGDTEQAICFARLKAADLVEEAFVCEPKWVLLGEDKALNRLDDGDFPGSVLIKLGFGPQSAFLQTQPAWQSEAKQIIQRVPYTVRFHLYQAKDLPASDDSGLLDPYFKVNVAGQRWNTEKHEEPGTKSHILRKRATTEPMYYHTQDFQVLMPPPEFKSFWPQVNVQLWDKDSFRDDYCGTLFCPLSDAEYEETQAAGQEIRHPQLPTWRDFFLEEEGDGEGSLLSSVQVVRRRDPNPSSPLPKPPSIVPDRVPAFLEIIAVGVRGLEPYAMLPIQYPYMELEVDVSRDDKRISKTENSKKPDGPNANFLQRITMRALLPKNDIFAPRIKVRVFDTRLGGFTKPLVAVGDISLEKKLPWTDAYSPPTANPRAAAAIAMKDKRGGEGAQESKESGDPLPPPPVKRSRSVISRGSRPGSRHMSSSSLLSELERAQQATQADAAGGAMTVVGGEAGTGAGGGAVEMQKMSGEEAGAGAGAGGVLGGVVVDTGDEVTASKVQGGARLDSSQALEALQGGKSDEWEAEEPPTYMKGRRQLNSDLEEELVTTPFETYELFRGQRFGGGEGYRCVGFFKCLVRVTEEDPDDDLLFVDASAFGSLEEARKENARVLGELLIPKAYKVRLYVLQAKNLTPMDPGIGGRPGKSDPYLLTKLGKETVDDSDSYILDVTDADLYKCVEFNAELPGASRMEINVMDYDDIGFNELIGRTNIDLEDRWFDSRWQALGLENRNIDLDNVSKSRYQTKPLELRPLTIPTAKAPQGMLQCWVDILTPADAGLFQPDDVALPPVAQFEVRVVIWKCKEVVAMDTLENMNDLYVKAWVEGCDPQVTDTHWRAKSGKGSFNWRMKFKVDLGPRTRSYKFPYLTLQMWDKDVVMHNDVIAESMVDLGAAFRRAFKKKETVIMFEDTAEKIAQLKAEAEADAANMAIDSANPNPADGMAQQSQGLLQQQGDSAAGSVVSLEGLEEGQAQAATATATATGGEGEGETDMVGGVVGGAGQTPDLMAGLGAAKVGDSTAAVPPGLSGNTGKKPKNKKGGYEGMADDGVGPEEEDREADGGDWISQTLFVSDSSTKPKPRQRQQQQQQQRPRVGGKSGTKANPKRAGRPAEKDQDREDAQDFINTVKEMTGFGGRPRESQWIAMERTNFSKGGVKEPMGRCLIGVQVWPIEKAEMYPVGAGRSDPNSNPYCPPPTGRLRWSWNPFVLGAELCGPKICCWLSCACCCVLCILLLVFCQPILNLAIAIMFK